MPDTDKDKKKQAVPPEGDQDTAAAAKAEPKPTATPKAKPAGGGNTALSGDMDFLLDIPLEISVELGRTKMQINELLHLGQGSVIELSKLAGETLEIFANQKLVARGEVVVVNEKYGIRLSEIISPRERIKGLK
jgi:flagellar motor switch protein FliN/FliY